MNEEKNSIKALKQLIINNSKKIITVVSISLIIGTTIINCIFYKCLIDKGYYFNNLYLSSIEVGLIGAMITAYAIIYAINYNEKILGHTIKIWVLRKNKGIYLFTPKYLLICLCILLLIGIIAEELYLNVLVGVCGIIFIASFFYLLHLIFIIVDKRGKLITDIKHACLKKKNAIEIKDSIYSALCNQYLIYDDDKIEIVSKHNLYFDDELQAILEIFNENTELNNIKFVPNKRYEHIVSIMFYMICEEEKISPYTWYICKENEEKKNDSKHKKNEKEQYVCDTYNQIVKYFLESLTSSQNRSCAKDKFLSLINNTNDQEKCVKSQNDKNNGKNESASINKSKISILQSDNSDSELLKQINDLQTSYIKSIETISNESLDIMKKMSQDYIDSISTFSNESLDIMKKNTQNYINNYKDSSGIIDNLSMDISSKKNTSLFSKWIAIIGTLLNL